MSNSHIQTFNNLLSTLEEVARRLLNGEICSPQEIWQIEIDLVNFQTNIQRYIKEEKSRLIQLNNVTTFITRLTMLMIFFQGSTGNLFRCMN